MGEWQQIGKHRAQRVGEDLFIEMGGDHELADAKIIYPMIQELREKNPYVYVLFDCTKATSIMSQDVRRYVVDWTRRQKPHQGQTIVIGASLLTRTLTQMVVRVAAVFTKRDPRVMFAVSADEAWALVAKLRAEQAR